MSKQPWQVPVDSNLRETLAFRTGDPRITDALLPLVQAEIDRAVRAERQRIAAAIRAEANRARRDGLDVTPAALDLAADIALEETGHA